VKRRGPVGVFFLFAGLMHFLRTDLYQAIVPDYLPAHRELVYASGVAEMAGGAAVLSERTARPGGWWLIATLIAVFPANLHMALHPDRYRNIPEPLLWARLPFQGVFIAWVWRVALRAS
jgi:uncharacterized membrane protein